MFWKSAEDRADETIDNVRAFLNAGKPDECEFLEAIEDVHEEIEEAEDLKAQARAALARAKTEGAAKAGEVLAAAKAEAEQIVLNAHVNADTIRRAAKTRAQEQLIASASDEQMVRSIPFREHCRAMAAILWAGYQIVCRLGDQRAAEWGDKARKAKERFDKLDREATRRFD